MISQKQAKRFSVIVSNEDTYAEYRFARRLFALLGENAVFSEGDGGKHEDRYPIWVGHSEDAAEHFYYTVQVKRTQTEIFAGSPYGFEYAFAYCKEHLTALIEAAASGTETTVHTDIRPLMDRDNISPVYRKTGEFRLMDFNILGTGDGRPHLLRNRMLAEMVLEVAPDILCIDEMYPDMRKEENGAIHAALRAHNYEEADTGMLDIGKLTMATVFYRSDLFRLLEKGVRNMMDAHRIDKQTDWAVLEHRNTGRRLIVVVTHLAHQQDPQGNADRLEMLNGTVFPVVDDLRAKYKNAPVILCGDMNCMAGSAPLARICEYGFADAMELAEDSDPSPSNYHENPIFNKDAGVFEREANSKMYALPIDHIYCLGEGVRFSAYRVLRDTCTGAISDHVPVVTDFDLR